MIEFDKWVAQEEQARWVRPSDLSGLRLAFAAGMAVNEVKYKAEYEVAILLVKAWRMEYDKVKAELEQHRDNPYCELNVKEGT